VKEAGRHFEEEPYHIPARIKAVLFDLDNTLVDLARAEREAAKAFFSENPCLWGNESPEEFADKWQAVTKKHYVLYERGEISIFEQRRRRIREMYSDPGLSDDRADSRYARYNRCFEEAWRLYPEALDCLERLRSLRLAVISNGDKETQEKKLKRLGISSFFSLRLFPADTGVFKPDPKAFLQACRIMDIPLGDCLSIGDDIEFDIAPCRKIGIEAVLVDRERRWIESAPCPRVTSLNDILAPEG
jgi:putative hydrolase of the HAD superfamily